MRHVDRGTGDGDAGVVEHHISPAVALVGLLGQSVDGLLGRHIGHDFGHRVLTAEPAGGCVQAVRFDVGQHQAPTPLGQQAGGRQTDAARPSGDDRDPLVVCSERHGEQSCRRRRAGRRASAVAAVGHRPRIQFRHNATRVAIAKPTGAALRSIFSPNAARVPSPRPTRVAVRQTQPARPTIRDPTPVGQPYAPPARPTPPGVSPCSYTSEAGPTMSGSGTPTMESSRRGYSNRLST